MYNLEMLRELDFDYLVNFVDTQCKDEFLFAATTTQTGWHSSVIFDNGELYITGALSQGTVTMSQYEGTSLTLYNFDYSINFDDNVFAYGFYDIILEKDEQDKLYKVLMNEFYCADDFENDEVVTIDELINEYDLCINDIIFKYMNDVYNKYLNECIEANWDEYYRQIVLDEIWDNIENEMFRLAEQEL